MLRRVKLIISGDLETSGAVKGTCNVAKYIQVTFSNNQKYPVIDRGTVAVLKPRHNMEYL